MTGIQSRHGANAFRTAFLVHRWTSLVCTVFLFMLCLTGLPLVFSDELHQWLEPHRYIELPADTPRANLDDIVAAGHRLFPREVVVSLYIDDDEPQIYLWMAPSFKAAAADSRVEHSIRFDARTAQVLEVSNTGSKSNSFMDIVLRLHTDLFAGLAGELFLALMALMFVLAIATGIVLYGPFMKKLDFGTVRTDRNIRVRWLDLHNALGITTVAWALVVGATGLMNELSTPLFALWQHVDVSRAAYARETSGARNPTTSGHHVLVQTAFDMAQRTVASSTFVSIEFPGSESSGPDHYLVWGRGSSTLTSRLFTPVLVNARESGTPTLLGMPWYLRALEISRPLHFGDYGGLPLKLLWVLLDLLTLVVLGSGLYLWVARRKQQTARIERLLAAHASPDVTSSRDATSP
ncbi:Peptidase [Pararobbsia alpina]|uniref:PepSY-associated TM helix domain-containing protein n=1 Tax=Pararobbsia alpina TaxID=621374 RepID=UPI0039A774C4